MPLDRSGSSGRPSTWLRTTAKQGESPRRELERQVKVFFDLGDAKLKFCDLEKARIRHAHPIRPVIFRNIELDLVKAASDVVPLAYRVVKQAVLSAFSPRDFLIIAICAAQANLETGGGHAAGDVDGVNGNAAGLVCV